MKAFNIKLQLVGNDTLTNETIEAGSILAASALEATDKARKIYKEGLTLSNGESAFLNAINAYAA